MCRVSSPSVIPVPAVATRDRRSRGYGLGRIFPRNPFQPASQRARTERTVAATRNACIIRSNMRMKIPEWRSCLCPPLYGYYCWCYCKPEVHCLPHSCRCISYFRSLLWRCSPLAPVLEDFSFSFPFFYPPFFWFCISKFMCTVLKV